MKEKRYKKYKFWINDWKRSFQVVVEGKVRYEAESAAKMQYANANAKSVSFVGEVR